MACRSRCFESRYNVKTDAHGVVSWKCRFEELEAADKERIHQARALFNMSSVAKAPGFGFASGDPVLTQQVTWGMGEDAVETNTEAQ